MTDEQFRVQTRLMAAGVAIHLARRLASWDGATARIASIYDGAAVDIACDSLLLVAARDPVDTLARELAAMREGGELDHVETLHTIGDAFVPGAIYAAVYAGHRAAREFGETIDPDAVGYVRELVESGQQGGGAAMNDVVARPRRRERSVRTTGLRQLPFARIRNPYKPVEILSADHLEAIHRASTRLLAEVGVEVMHEESRQILAGPARKWTRPPSGCAAILRWSRRRSPRRRPPSPSRPAIPAKSIVIGGDQLVFSSVGGPAFANDLDRGRRAGNSADMRDYIKLVQSLNVIHQEGGGPIEPTDLPAESRHLDFYEAALTLTDKILGMLGAGRLSRARCHRDDQHRPWHSARQDGPADHRHHRHQHQFAAASGQCHGGGADRAGRAPARPPS